ncbi:MAG: glycosyltransferase [Akkermansia sp.]|nr:glycosyltransferase [Akkermansia sp.]
MPPLPKLSYVLLSHNREKYVRAAVESALAQDYEGEMEYIFSDDCSTDRTFEIIKECVAAYKGTRRVVVTQPPTNLKTAGNFNHAVSLAQGDWIIRADDDDISAIDRCSVIGKVVSSIPGCTYVATESSYYFQDEEEAAAVETSRIPCAQGMSTREIDIRTMSPGQCAFLSKEYSYKAWNMACFRTFGDIPAAAHLADDYILYFRASVLGKGVLVDNANAVLVRNNSMHQSIGSDNRNEGYRDIMRRERLFDEYQNSTAAPMRQTYEDLLDFARRMPQDEQPGVLAFLADMQEKICVTETLRSYWRKGTINRVRMARELGMTRPYDMLRCLPMPVFAALLALIRKIKS